MNEKKLNPFILQLITLGMVLDPDTLLTRHKIIKDESLPQTEETKKFYLNKAEEKRKRKMSKKKKLSLYLKGIK